MTRYHATCRGILLLGFATTTAGTQPAIPTVAAAEELPGRPVVSTVAGGEKQAGSADGPAATARFSRPMGIALTPDGTLYVADTHNHTIRRISAAGEVSTVAGLAGARGSTDGVGAAARFSSPVGLALDAQGVLYVADAENQLIRKITPAGVVSTLAGTAGTKGSTDGPGNQARFNFPHGVAVAADGALYVTDTESHTIRRVAATGEVTTVAGAAGRKGSTDGAGPGARFVHPSGIAAGAAGTLYVVDNGNHTIRVLSLAGAVRTLAGTAGKSGYADGAGAAARFDWPNGIAADAAGVLYVADNVNSTLRRITPAGEVTTVAGSPRGWGRQDGEGPAARFRFPFGVAVAAAGTAVYITDTQNQLIRRVQFTR